MERFMNTLLAGLSLFLITYAGHYSLEQISSWVQQQALEKAASDLGSMEKMSQRLTGGEVDF